jgi:MFS family permease
MAVVTGERSVLSTRHGAALLVLLCAVQFMDIVDSSIMNVALPSIRTDLGFTQQQLQWVLSGYLVAYGGFLLLGGRMADLIGRRRLLVAGTILFAACSLAGGLATNAGTLVGARVVQGVGAALMAPAGLSILTTTFTEGRDRTRALGVWGAISGVAAAAGVFLGGVLSRGARLALGAVRQHPGLRTHRRRRVPPRARRAGPRPIRPVRHPRRGAGHRGDAGTRIRAGEGPGRGLDNPDHDR